MRIVSLLAQERRLLLLCAVSVALHLLALGLIVPSAERARDGDAAPRIAVTLRPPVTAPAPIAAAIPAPAPQPAPRPVASSVRPALQAALATVAGEPAAAPSPAPPLAGAGWNAVAAGQGEAPVQMPGRYQARPPPPVLLAFALTRTGPGQAPEAAGAASIDWRIGAGGYSLSVEGVAGALYSKGALGDAGITPQSASETLADGALALTRFDEPARRIEFSASAKTYRLLTGSQDRASLLMQLAGIGLANPEQVKDVLEFYVGAGADAGVVRFQVLGPEQIDSALGKLESVHLVQLARPGEARLEVWLAPGRHWLPVQLRVTQPDGSALTQLVTAITER